jgi:phosphatidylglycerophosphatase C
MSAPEAADATTATTVVVAAFDVDGTLTTRDCVGPFLVRIGGRRSLVLAVLRRPVATVVGLARRDRDRLKEVLVGGVLRGRTIAAVAEEGERFAAHVEATLLRPDTLARLRWHQAAGHRTVLVSASLRPYLDPLAARLGVEHVVCTDVLADGARYVHLLRGRNCRGPEKVARLRALLDAHRMGAADLWAYGDSTGDRELLAAAHHAVWVKGITVPAVPGGPVR